jgi:hypothetical protein
MVPEGVDWHVISVMSAVRYSLSGIALSDMFVYTVKQLSNVRHVRKLLLEVTILKHTEELILGRSHIVAAFAISVLHTEGRV